MNIFNKIRFHVVIAKVKKISNKRTLKTRFKENNNCLLNHLIFKLIL